MARTQAAVPACDRDLFTLYAQADDAAIGEEMLSLLSASQEIDARIMVTRARTPAGIARKVKEVLDCMNTQEDEPDCWYRRMLRSVLADLVAMEPTPAAGVDRATPRCCASAPLRRGFFFGERHANIGRVTV